LLERGPSPTHDHFHCWRPETGGPPTGIRVSYGASCSPCKPGAATRVHDTISVSIGTISTGGLPERPKGAGCKPAGLCLRWFESSTLHSNVSQSSGAPTPLENVSQSSGAPTPLENAPCWAGQSLVGSVALAV